MSNRAKSSNKAPMPEENKVRKAEENITASAGNKMAIGTNTMLSNRIKTTKYTNGKKEDENAWETVSMRPSTCAAHRRTSAQHPQQEATDATSFNAVEIASEAKVSPKKKEKKKLPIPAIMATKKILKNGTIILFDTLKDANHNLNRFLSL